MIRSMTRSTLLTSEWYKSLLAGNEAIIPRISVAGYAAGWTTTVDKFAFPSESRTTLATGLSSARRHQGFGDSGVAGYAGGGNFSTTVDKFAFPADSRSTLATGLSVTSDWGGAMSDSGVAGYFFIGTTTPVQTFVGTVNKFAFPSDSRSTIAGSISPLRRAPACFANFGVAGYISGGQEDPTVRSDVSKIAFPSDSVSNLATGLSSTRSFTMQGFSNQGVAGYSAGGFNGSVRLATVDKFAFPSDTRSTLGTGLSTIRGSGAGFSDSGLAGYMAGGFNDSTDVTTVDKFAFPADTRTTLGTGLSAARQTSGFANEGVF